MKKSAGNIFAALLLIAFAAAAMSCVAALADVSASPGVSRDPLKYFPLAPGRMWTWRMDPSADGGINRLYDEKVVKTDGDKIVTVSSEYENDKQIKVTENSYETKSDGIYVTRKMTTDLQSNSTAMVEYLEPCKAVPLWPAGEKMWSCGGSIAIGNMEVPFQDEFQVEAVEKVVDGTGEHEKCLKVRYTRTMKRENNPFNQSALKWYCPGVGMAQSETGNKQIHLISINFKVVDESTADFPAPEVSSPSSGAADAQNAASKETAASSEPEAVDYGELYVTHGKTVVFIKSSDAAVPDIGIIGWSADGKFVAYSENLPAEGGLPERMMLFIVEVARGRVVSKGEKYIYEDMQPVAKSGDARLEQLNEAVVKEYANGLDQFKIKRIPGTVLIMDRSSLGLADGKANPGGRIAMILSSGGSGVFTLVPEAIAGWGGKKIVTWNFGSGITNASKSSTSKTAPTAKTSTSGAAVSKKPAAIKEKPVIKVADKPVAKQAKAPEKIEKSPAKPAVSPPEAIPSQPTAPPSSIETATGSIPVPPMPQPEETPEKLIYENEQNNAVAENKNIPAKPEKAQKTKPVTEIKNALTAKTTPPAAALAKSPSSAPSAAKTPLPTLPGETGPVVSDAKQCPPGTAYVPKGSFTMGCSEGDEKCDMDEWPAHKVMITKGFCIDKTEVTQGQYTKALGKNPSVNTSCGANCPVEMVSWADAATYCEMTGRRLPTEAEWEYAARGGAKTQYYWGSSSDNMDDYVWDQKNTVKPNPVAQKKPNKYGLYDMLGGMWEWTQDCFGNEWYDKSGLKDPINNAPNCAYRAIRGGSRANADHAYHRVSKRIPEPKDSKTRYIGFRCVTNYPLLFKKELLEGSAPPLNTSPKAASAKPVPAPVEKLVKPGPTMTGPFTPMVKESAPSGKKCKSGMIYVPPGDYMIGCDGATPGCKWPSRPRHQATITKGFCVDSFLTTQKTYDKKVGYLNYYGNNCGLTCPASMISWDEAETYCENAGKRLLTEVEWEVAAAKGLLRNQPEKGNVLGTSGLGFAAGGGVVKDAWEWVYDCYDEKWYSKSPATDPVNKSLSCGKRTLRGGAVSTNESAYLNLYSRKGATSATRDKRTGFRCATNK